jgi:hypothetical protein
MAKSDLQVRPVYYRTRDSIKAHLTIVLAALAVSRWIEQHTGWPIRRFGKTARRYRTIQIQAGQHLITAAGPIPDDLRHAIDTINSSLNWDPADRLPRCRARGRRRPRGRDPGGTQAVRPIRNVVHVLSSDAWMMCWMSVICGCGTAKPTCSTVSASRRAAVRCSPCSGRTARARPPRSRSSRGSGCVRRGQRARRRPRARR